MTTELITADCSSRSCREAEAIRYFKILGHERNGARTLPDVRQRLAGWEDIDTLADWAVDQSPGPESSTALQGVFLSVNEMTEKRFLELANGKASGTVADRDIEKRTEFYIDIDPNRDHPDGGKVCASDEERVWAEAALETVMMVATSHGFPQPLVVDSGNGYQVYYRIALPNDEVSKALIKAVLKSFAQLVDCDRGHVDVTVYNAARLARIPGTFNQKGTHTTERPHRLATIAYAPDGDVLERVEATTLEAFVAWVAGINGQVVRSTTGADAPAKRSCLDATTIDQLVAEVKTYLDANGAPPIEAVRRDHDKEVLQFAYCPFRGSAHEDGAAAVIVWHSGAIGVKCFHAKCAEENWSTLQSLLGPAFTSGALVDYAEAHPDQVCRKYNDPLVLGRAHYENCRLGDSAPGLVFVYGEMYRYVVEAGWRQIASRELQASVRGTIQKAFDADFVGKPLRDYATPVRAGDITNTVKALESLAYFPVDNSVAPPFWLTEAIQANPLDLLVVKNGIVDVRAYAQQLAHFVPRTSLLFTEAVGTYDYDPLRRDAPHWQGFLDSLEQPPEWHALLQQIMGCCLCAGYDLQKIFMLVGPPRCGKGTITRVLENQLGHHNVCSPKLVDFCKPFGLEQALGKRLAIVPEVAFPSQSAHEIVATLKAISGGDLVTVDRKFIKNIPVRLPLKIMLVSNNYVALPDNSKALPGRLVPLRFTKSFMNKEDIELGAKLRGEQSAILNWSLEGFRSLYQANGKFTLPSSSQELMDQLSLESAPLQAFVQDVCMLDPRKAVFKTALYEAYKEWARCYDVEHSLLSTADFNRELLTAVSQIYPKRPTSRDYHQRDYTIVPTKHDAVSKGDRPEVWVGIFCRDHE